MTAFVIVRHQSDLERAEERLADYVLGDDGAEFVATDLQFRAVFPNMPQREEVTTDVAGVPLRYTSYVSTIDEGAFAVAGYTIPPGVAWDLNAALNGAAAGVDGTIDTAVETTFMGLPALEGSVRAGDVHLSMVLFQVFDRVYLIQALGDESPPEGYEAFKASFAFM